MVNKNIEIRNAKLKYKNFSGRATDFDPKGTRTFNVVLDEEIAHELKADGWNVKERTPKEEGMPVTYDMRVKIRYDNYPPVIAQVTSNGKKILKEEEIGMLDWAETTNIDLIIRPYNWENSTGSGVTAYLKTMVVTLDEDPLLAEYGLYDVSAEENGD